MTFNIMKRILNSNKKQTCILSTLIRSFSALELGKPCSRKEFSGSYHQSMLLLVISDLQFVEQTLLNTLYYLFITSSHVLCGAEEQRVRQRTDLPKRYSLGLLFRLPVSKLYLPQLCLSNIRQGFESPPLFKPEELFFFACGHVHPLSVSQILCTSLCIWVNVHWEQISWVVHAGPWH